MMTKQEVFDQVSSHLLMQNARSETTMCKDESGPTRSLCAYRGDDGGMCAAGKLIADEFYSPVLEGKRVTQQMVATALYASGVNMADLETATMVLALQGLHDNSPIQMWHAGLRNIAYKHGLNFQGVPATWTASDVRDVRVPVLRPLDITNLWMDESVMPDICMPTTAVLKVADRKPTHQLVPPDVTVKQWIANMPALDVGPEQGSQPAPSVAHKQGVTA